MLMYLSHRAVPSLGHQVIRTEESRSMASLQPQSSVNGYIGKLFAAAAYYPQRRLFEVVWF